MSFANAFSNLFKIAELRKRLSYTLLYLAIYRVGVFVTAPGVSRTVMKKYMETSGGFLNLLNLFTGGGFEQLSIFALGIMPYVSASIILQLLTVVVPALEKLSKEGEMGRRKITQYTRYGTIILSIVQGFGIARYLESLNAGTESVVPDDVKGWGFRLLTVITLTAGTAFIMWLGEQITERGIGNGISLIIFAGIVARIPQAAIQTYATFKAATRPTTTARSSLLVLGGVMLVTIGVIVYVERGQRKIPVHYAKRVVGRQTFSGQSTHLPLKVNTSGVIPPIFASSVLDLPGHARDLAAHAQARGRCDAARRLDLQRPLRHRHHLLHLLLHRGDLQPGGRGRQPQEVRRLHPGHSAGQEDGRLHRSRPLAASPLAVPST